MRAAEVGFSLKFDVQLNLSYSNNSYNLYFYFLSNLILDRSPSAIRLNQSLTKNDYEIYLITLDEFSGNTYIDITNESFVVASIVLAELVVSEVYTCEN